MIKLNLPKFNISKEAVCKTSCYLALVLFIASLVMQIFVTNKYSIKGAEMVSLKNQESLIAEEISTLKVSIAELSSLTNVENNAIALGFSEYMLPIASINSSIASITNSQFVAVR